MQNTSIKFSASKIILGLIISALAAGAGYYIWQDFVKHSVSNMPDSNGVGINGTGDFKIEQLPLESESTTGVGEMPDLDGPINITADLPEDAQKIAREKIEKIIQELKSDSSSLDNWLLLGIYKKMIGDYEGAEEAWKYAGVIRPKNSVSFNNLGDLYAYYLKDSAKAEENFLKALENGPDQVYIYRNTYDFYMNVMKDKIKAVAILKKGIELNPSSSQDLQNLLKSY